MDDSSLQALFELLLSSEVYACAWGYCRRLCLQSGGGRQDAEDLLQEALGYAWRGLAGLRDETRFKPWLLSIIRRRFLSQRSVRRPETVALPAEELPALDSEGQSLLIGLIGLPEAAREVLSLVYLHGLSPDEAAQVLGLSGPALRMRLSRGRRLLRHAIEGQGATMDVPARRSI